MNIPLLHMTSFLLNKYLGVEWLHHIVGVYLAFYETAKLFLKTSQWPCKVRIITPRDEEIQTQQYHVDLLNVTQLVSGKINQPTKQNKT